MAAPLTPVEPRFWPKVQVTTECWLWTAAQAKGYGKILVDGHLEYAHRVAWRLANGSIPAGLFVLHRCDTPLCVRPDHLFLGTHGDNMADMAAKGRNVKTHCGQGHLLGEADRQRRRCQKCQQAYQRARYITHWKAERKTSRERKRSAIAMASEK